MRSAECGIPVPRSNRECGQSRQCQPLNSAFLIPHSALSGGPMFPGLAPRGQCVVCGCVDSSRATCARRSARIRQSSTNPAIVRTSAAASVGIQWSRTSIVAKPYSFASIMIPRAMQGNAECEVRNAELQCRGRTGNAADRANAGRSIPHSAFRTPHSVTAPCSLRRVTKRSRSESFLTHRRLADLRRCDPDHHEVVADLLHTATVRTATTGRPGARLLRGAALRACHGCDVRSGHATRKSADGLELMPV